MVGRDQRRERRRQQFLECAKEAFADKGYQATTVDDIVGRVEVARGTFYLYFDDKRAVFEALLDGFFERVSSQVQPIDLRPEAAPPREQLRANITRVCALALGDPGMVRLALRQAPGLDPDLDEKLGQFYRALRTFIDESLAEGQAIGLVRAGDRSVMVSLALGGLKEILVDAVSGEIERSPEQLTDALMAFLEGGLLRD